MEPPIALVRWEEKDLDPNVFYESMTKARRCTKDSKLLSNHFKIMNNIYPTGEKLYMEVKNQ